MAMTLDEQETFVADASWLAKVGQAMATVARTVRAEASTTANHTLRADLSQRVLAEPALWADAFIRVVATDAALDTTPLDAELITAVEDAWDDVAGVPGPV